MRPDIGQAGRAQFGQFGPLGFGDMSGADELSRIPDSLGGRDVESPITANGLLPSTSPATPDRKASTQRSLYA